MAKYLKFRKVSKPGEPREYNVLNNKCQFLGHLLKEEITYRGKPVWKWIFNPDDDWRDPPFWTKECLDQLIEFIKTLK